MPVEPLSVLVLPMILALTALFAAAAVYDIRVFRRRKDRNKAVYRCEECRHIYTGLHLTPLARCTKCGRLNEPIRR